MTDVIVIGAGVGGLAAAISTAAHGRSVRVFEAAGRAGGKAGTAIIDGVEVDTGPSVVTLPDVFDRLFRAAGSRLEDEVTLRTVEPAFRYLYADGVALDMHHDIGQTLDSIRSTLGAGAADEMAAFLKYAEAIWGGRSAPNFVYGQAPSFATVMMRLGLMKLGDVRRIDSMRSMYKGICAYVKEPHTCAFCWPDTPRTMVRTCLDRPGHPQLHRPRRARPRRLWGRRAASRPWSDALVKAAERLGVRIPRSSVRSPTIDRGKNGRRVARD